jgi:hypothetical protein
MSADDVCCNITEPDTPHITLSGSSQRFNMPCLAILVFTARFGLMVGRKMKMLRCRVLFPRRSCRSGQFTRSLAWSAIVGFGQLPCANLV